MMQGVFLFVSISKKRENIKKERKKERKKEYKEKKVG
jgi:hypothetical protein